MSDTKSKVATRKVTGDTAVLQFANGKSLGFKVSDIPEAVHGKALLSAVLSAVVNGYSQHREDVEAAYKAAQDRLTAIIQRGEWPQRTAGSGRLSALDVAINVRADARKLPVEKVREVVMSFPKDKRVSFIATVKADPLTAAAFAAARAKKVSKEQDFGGV